MKGTGFRMLCAAMAMLPAGAAAADADSVSRYIPEVHATLRTRYEVATESGEARFQVRNARVNMNGDVTDFLGYFLRADFCDRGSFKMLDAYAIFLSLIPISEPTRLMRISYAVFCLKKKKNLTVMLLSVTSKFFSTVPKSRA